MSKLGHSVGCRLQSNQGILQNNCWQFQISIPPESSVTFHLYFGMRTKCQIQNIQCSVCYEKKEEEGNHLFKSFDLRQRFKVIILNIFDNLIYYMSGIKRRNWTVNFSIFHLEKPQKQLMRLQKTPHLVLGGKWKWPGRVIGQRTCLKSPLNIFKEETEQQIMCVVYLFWSSNQISEL